MLSVININSLAEWTLLLSIKCKHQPCMVVPCVWVCSRKGDRERERNCPRNREAAMKLRMCVNLLFVACIGITVCIRLWIYKGCVSISMRVWLSLASTMHKYVNIRNSPTTTTIPPAAATHSTIHTIWKSNNMRSFVKWNMYADWQLLSIVVFVRTWHIYTRYSHTNIWKHSRA